MRRGGPHRPLTLAVLGAILVSAASWGWSAVTEPFPGRSTPPVCVDTAVCRGRARSTPAR